MMLSFVPPAAPVLSEVFCAIQGEGSLAGTPAVFLVSVDGAARPVWSRAPRAAWKVEWGMSMGGLVAAVRRSWYDYAVITGGEPLRVEALPELAAKLREFEHHVTVETSGGVFVEGFPCDLMSVNIRVGDAAGKKKKKAAEWPAFDMDVLRKIVEHYPHQLKFHCGAAEEWDEIKRIAGESNVKRSNVFLIPTATKAKELAAQMEWVEELSRVQGYRLAPRMSE